MGDFLKADVEGASVRKGTANTVNYDDMEPWTRVSPRDYDRNIREMVTLGARPGRPRRCCSTTSCGRKARIARC